MVVGAVVYAERRRWCPCPSVGVWLPAGLNTRQKRADALMGIRDLSLGISIATTVADCLYLIRNRRRDAPCSDFEVCFRDDRQITSPIVPQ